jgi:hypothetical protein
MRTQWSSFVAADGQTEQLGNSWTVAAWTPLVCALHCAAVPALALVLPALVVPDAIELVLMLAATLIAGVLLRTGIRTHGRLRVLAPAFAGLLLWGMALAELSAAPEWVVGGAGGVLIFGGLRWNARLHAASARRCGCASCD